MEALDDERGDDEIRSWRANDIAVRAGASRDTALRTLIPGLVGAGVLGRRGRYWYGRAREVDLWLTGQWPSSARAGVAT